MAKTKKHLKMQHPGDVPTLPPRKKHGKKKSVARKKPAVIKPAVLEKPKGQVLLPVKIAPAERELMPHEIVEQTLIDAAAARRQMWSVVSNRASELGHPCARYLVYLRITPPEARAMYSTELQFIFELGRHLENRAKAMLQDSGFKLYDEPKGKHWQKYNITGKIDTRTNWRDKVIPIEIKWINDHLWQKIAAEPSVDTLWASPRAYVQKIPGQLLLYLLLHNVDEGFWFFGNKQTGRPKIVWLYLEPYLEYAESLLKKAELVNKHVARGTLPDKIENFDICGDCEMNSRCLPDVAHGDALEILKDDPEFIEMLDERAAAHDDKKKFDRLDRRCKKRFAAIDKDKFLIGEYVIQRKLIQTPERIQPANEFFKYSIVKMGAAIGEDE